MVVHYTPLRLDPRAGIQGLFWVQSPFSSKLLLTVAYTHPSRRRPDDRVPIETYPGLPKQHKDLHNFNTRQFLPTVQKAYPQNNSSKKQIADSRAFLDSAVYVDRTHDLQIDFPKFDFSLTLSQLS